MKKNILNTKLIAIDGPNGSGKSSIIKEIYEILNKKNLSVLVTKEPTESSLGKYIRVNQDSFKKETLACLVAADRYQHLESLSEELKTKNIDIILMDRYIFSSYILQRIDGLSFDFIDDLNQNIVFPDLQIVLVASPETLSSRLNDRNSKSRFEALNNSSQIECDFTYAGIEKLKEKNISYHIIDTDNKNSKESAIEISKLILNFINN